MSAATAERFRIAPVLTAVVLTILLLWLIGAVAELFLLLFIAILLALYLSALAEFFSRRLALQRRGAFLLALTLTLVAIVGFVWMLIPPVVRQTQQLMTVLPAYLAEWELAIQGILARIPGLGDTAREGEHLVLHAVYDQIGGYLGDFVPKLVLVVQGVVSVVAIFVMAIYLTLYPALYRDWLVALFPPVHRDLVSDVLGDLGTTLRAWIVGQLFTMFLLAILTAIGLWILRVPFWLTFGLFAGVVAIVPFFGTLLATVVPALFVLGGGGLWGTGPVGHFWFVILLGVVIHTLESNVIAPLVMHRQVSLPPVLTMMAVLIFGKLLGPVGLLGAVPALAVIMVVLRRILLERIYEGHGFRRTLRAVGHPVVTVRRGAAQEPVPDARVQDERTREAWTAEPEPAAAETPRPDGTAAALARARFAILADGQLGPLSSKTANGCIRYHPRKVAAVIDSAHAGRIVQDVLGFGGDIPIVATLEEALAYGPTDLLIGIAPVGGRLPREWVLLVRRAVERGLHIWSGLHEFLADHPDIGPLAQERGVRIHDLRRPPPAIPVASGRVRDVDATVVLTVGSDCNIGKMTAALCIRDELRRRGHRVAFAGTGQTGILIEGWGIAVDAVVADFISGAAEQLVIEAAREADIVLVEGQGSIIHPGYSGVTHGLLHGSMPHAMILCTQPTRKFCETDPWMPLPPLRDLVEMHERVMAPLRPSRVVGVSLFTADLERAEAERAIESAARETGLPTTDPVRFEAGPLAEAVERVHLERRVGR